VVVIVGLLSDGDDGLVDALAWPPEVTVGVGVELAEPPEEPVARPAPPPAPVPCRPVGDVDEEGVATDVEPGPDRAWPLAR
jgi:hypothetical protein